MGHEFIVVSLEQSGFMLFADINRQTLAHQVSNVVRSAAFTAGLEVNHEDIVAIAKKEIVQTVIKVHNRVRHCGKSIKQLMHIATELFHQRNHVCINSVGENLQESWERLLVNAGSDFHPFAVDRRHPFKCIKAG